MWEAPAAVFHYYIVALPRNKERMKLMKKKIFGTLLCLCLVLTLCLLAACGGKPEESATEKPTEKPTETETKVPE